MGLTNIEWTASIGKDGEVVPGYSWSPWWGCVEVSPACDHCYARELDKRYGGKHWGKEAPRREMSTAHWKQPLAWDRAAARDGVRKRVFPSMCDPFEFRPLDENFGADLDRLRGDFWHLIESTPSLVWLLLTKRPQNIKRMFPDRWSGYTPENIWLGTTLENKAAVWRIEALRSVPAMVRFLSIEPLLEDLGTLDLTGIHWVIVGGESGHHARPMHPDWVRSVRDQCLAAKVPFFFKQWGEWGQYRRDLVQLGSPLTTAAGYSPRQLQVGTGLPMLRYGKKAAGRLLDGVEWSQFPKSFDPMLGEQPYA